MIHEPRYSCAMQRKLISEHSPSKPSILLKTDFGHTVYPLPNVFMKFIPTHAYLFPHPFLCGLNNTVEYPLFIIRNFASVILHHRMSFSSMNLQSHLLSKAKFISIKDLLRYWFFNPILCHQVVLFPIRVVPKKSRLNWSQTLSNIYWDCQNRYIIHG